MEDGTGRDALHSPSGSTVKVRHPSRSRSATTFETTLFNDARAELCKGLAAKALTTSWDSTLDAHQQRPAGGVGDELPPQWILSERTP